MKGAGKAWPLAMLVFISVGIGLQYSLNRLATVNGVPFIPYVFWMAILSGAALLVLALVRGAPPPLGWPHLRSYALLAIAGFSAPLTMFAFIAPKLPASIVSLVSALIPGLTYLIALGIGMERLRAFGIAGLALGLAGVLLIVLPETSPPRSGHGGMDAAGDSGPGFVRPFDYRRRQVPPARDEFGLDGRRGGALRRALPGAGNGGGRKLVVLRFGV